MLVFQPRKNWNGFTPPVNFAKRPSGEDPGKTGSFSVEDPLRESRAIPPPPASMDFKKMPESF